MYLNTILAVTENCRTECQDYISNENVAAGKASSNGPQEFLASARFSNSNGLPYRHLDLRCAHH
jgi:hypothetical protein